MNLKELPITKFYGLNTTTAPINLTFEATSLKNFIIRYLGKLTVRDGTTLVGDDTGVANQMGLSHWRDEDTVVQIRVSGTNIEKLSAGSWSTMSGGTGLATGKKMNFCQAGDYLYGFNASDYVKKINGSSVSDVTTIPKGAWGVWWRNYLFVGGVVNYPNRVYFSNINLPETFSVDDYFDIEPGNGDFLTGGIALKDKILFSKSRAWYYLTGSGTNSFAIYPVTYDFGACTYRAITSYGNDVWCMDIEGNIRSVLRNPYGLLTGQDMSSEYIKNTIKTINLNQLDDVCSISNDGFVYFSVASGSSTTNDLTIVYDGDCPVPNGKSKWTTFTGFVPSNYDVIDENLYFSDGSGKGKTYVFGGDTDNGVDISCEWVGSQMEIDTSGQKKRFTILKWFGFPLGNYHADVSVSMDEGLFQPLGEFNLKPDSPLWGDVGAVWGEGIWGVVGQVKNTFHYSSSGRVIANKIQHKLTYSSGSGKAEFGSYSIYYQIKNFRNL